MSDIATDRAAETILLAEDSRDTALLVETMLRRGGFTTHVCENGRQALEWLADNDPALIISDWMMPLLDGVELCRRIRADRRLAHTYFMLLTARSGADNVAHALDAGVDEFITKPIHYDELLARVRAGLRQRRMTDRLVQAEKQRAIATLTRGMAHDFNNMLGSIVSNLSVLDPAQLSGEQRETLDDIRLALSRMSELTRQLLAFSGQGGYLRRPVDLNALVSKVMQLHHPHRIEWIKLDLQPDLPRIEGDPGQLEQVVFHLLENAVEALETRIGDVHVSTRLALEPPKAWDERPSERGPRVVLEVADEGVGMSSEVLSKVFDPFYSTKFPGRGLGMAAVQGIVSSHGGRVHVDSTEGEGTRVLVVLAGSPDPAPEGDG